MIPIYLNTVLIRFLGDVSLTMRLEMSSLFVTTKHVGGILVGRKQLSKFSSVVCIGLPYSKMPIYTVRVVLDVNSLGKSVGEI